MFCEVITNNALTVEVWMRIYWRTNICGIANHYRESSHQLIELINTILTVFGPFAQLVTLFFIIKGVVRSCDPCGDCSSFAEELNIYDITWITTDFTLECINPQIILLHDTATVGALQTVQDLHQEKLSVQYIRRGGFRTMNGDPSLNSIGIEAVNNGQTPLLEPQLQSIYKLVGKLKKRWNVDDHMIISHGDIAPDRKMDISGYFHYRDLYDYLNIFPGLFDTELSPAEQKIVLIDQQIGTEDYIANVQENLKQYGYNYLPMKQGQWNENTKLNMQAFNRHFCPEIFELEQFGIHLPNNQRWYKISEERLQKLLKT
ncbi:hypothetical protein WR25_02485 [Diploscapter pachys]|uniref:N-acetylmuramoyl-L-alanine amidase domain-containing protein n=1 Tax=Diploscapter pachys TaxID=2018661 RepID=A0A2A2KNH3_9BILA|nr:hypothetical protein WR25_02485 [Diploscapter pachys]